MISLRLLALVERASFAGTGLAAGNEAGRDLAEEQALRAHQDRRNGVVIADKANRFQLGPIKIDLQYR